MKRMIVLAALASLAAVPAAAEPRKQDLLHVDSGFGGSWAWNLGNPGAFGIHGVVEPKIFILDELAVGLRIDGGAQVGVGLQTGAEATQVDTVLHIPVANLVKVEYYFGKDGFRPFVGVGGGYYLSVLQSVSAGGGGQLPAVFQGVSNLFGVAPQLGLDFGGVRLAATYNLILGGEILLQQEVGGPQTSIRRDYLGVELTFKTWGMSF